MRKRTIILQRIFLIVLLGYLCPFRLLAQDRYGIQAQADTDKIRIGEQVKLQLTAKVNPDQLKAANLRLNFPSLPDSFNHWEVVNRSPIDTVASANNSGTFFKQTITLTSFDSGRWEIPALRFDVLDASNNATDSAFSEPIGIDVNTVTVDTTKAFKPIKTVRAVPWSIWDYWVYMAIGAAAVLLALGLWWYFRRRPIKEKAAPAAPLEPVYDRTLRLLKELDAEKVWQQGQVKEYYSRLTDILRSYFEEQFGIAALEQTSAELLQNIKPVTILNQQRDKLRALLSLADLAKFAKLQPTPEEHTDSMNKAVEIVEWTKPAARPAADAEGKTQNAESGKQQA
ncbi:MAG TPA: BatD family protein [Chitinophaga sp.]|uniref:BatD family protein n=1 Tax=Chitinophaga sp. TaxID=1869181 RepID=UPI002DBDD3E2|nr:BatD family protein [Chitinophaga sp.]HEU4553082.1 BatD family protein [Chitinophaga sp.]